MIISDVFPGDNNTTLKRVQHDLYPQSVVAIFEAALRTMVLADAVLMTNLELVTKAKAIERFDHRVLQDAHDILAARFRHLHDDGGQIDLLDPADPNVMYIQAWSDWRASQLKELATYPDFVRSAVEAVVFANTEFGYIAEQQLCNTLITHVVMEDWAPSARYVSQYRGLSTPSMRYP